MLCNPVHGVIILIHYTPVIEQQIGWLDKISFNSKTKYGLAEWLDGSSDENQSTTILVLHTQVPFDQ